MSLERLEARELLSGGSISIADATVNETGAASGFVSAGSGGLTGPRDLIFGPDGNLYVGNGSASGAGNLG